MRCSNPDRGQASSYAKEVEGRIRTRVLLRRFDQLAVREYEQGSLLDEEVLEFDDAIAAERALRLRESEWEAEGWVQLGTAVGFQEGRGLDSESARLMGEGEVDAGTIARAREREAASHKTRTRRNARYEKLHTAIEEGRVDDALELLRKRYPRTPYESSYEPALELAAQRGYTALVERLVRKPEYIELAVIEAASAGRLELLRRLVEDLGGDPSSGGLIGPSALMAAALAGHLEVVAYLLDRGADRNATLSGSNAAELAAEAGHQAVADLLARRSDHSPDHQSERLFQAIAEDRPEDVRKLVAGGAQVDAQNEKGNTPLNEAIRERYGRPVTVAALLEAGADPSRVDGEGWSPWMACSAMRANRAAKAEQDEIAELLERAGASKEGETYLELQQAAREGDEARVAELLAEGGGPDDGPVSLSPLESAAREGHDRIVELLLEVGAEVDRREPEHFTPLITAAYYGHLAAVKRLVAAGASLEAEVGGSTNAAGYAAMAQHTAVVEWLEQHGSATERLVGAIFEADRGARLGWPLFYRHVDMGNGEYSLLLVEAPIEEVAPAVARHIDGARHFGAIDVEPATIHPRAWPLYTVQLKDRAWTIVIHGMGSLSYGVFEEGRALAAALARQHGWRIVYASENDTDGETWFRLIDDAEGAHGTDPKLLRDLGIELPGFDPWDARGLRLIGVTREGVERVDVIERPQA